MKSPHRLLQVALFALCLCAGYALFAEQPPAPANTEKIPPERFDAKVLKVFAAKDGEAIFRAYVVKWKDQEVIVSDPLARSDFKEGDTITVLAMNLPYPQNKESYRLLGFTVISR